MVYAESKAEAVEKLRDEDLEFASVKDGENDRGWICGFTRQIFGRYAAAGGRSRGHLYFCSPVLLYCRPSAIAPGLLNRKPRNQPHV